MYKLYTVLVGVHVEVIELSRHLAVVMRCLYSTNPSLRVTAFEGNLRCSNCCGTGFLSRI